MSEATQKKIKEITLDENTVLIEVQSNTEWDGHAEKVLVDMRLVKKYDAIQRAMREAANEPAINAITFSVEPAILFLELSDVTFDDVDELADDELESLVIIEGKIYKCSEDECTFSENTWQFNSMSFHAYGHVGVNYYAKHTSDELWYTLSVPDEQAEAA